MKIVGQVELRNLTAKILQSAGAPSKASEFAAEMLVRSNLYGVDSHGVIRIPEYIRYINDGKVVPSAKPVVTRQTKVTATGSGSQGNRRRR